MRKKTIWTYIIKRKWVMLHLLWWTMTGSLVTSVWGIAIANAVTQLMNQQWENFLFWIMILIGNFMMWVVQIAMHSRTYSRAVQLADQDIRDDIMQVVSQYSHTQFHSIDEGAYVSWLVNDIQTINDYGFATLEMMISQVFLVVFSISTLWYFHYSLLGSIAGLTLLMFVVPKLFTKQMNQSLTNVSKANEVFLNQMSGWIGVYTMLSAFQKKPFVRRKVSTESERLAKHRVHYATVSGVMQAAVNGTSLSSQIILLIQTAWLFAKGIVPIGAISAAQYFSAMIFSSLTGFSSNWLEFLTVQAIFDKIFMTHSQGTEVNVEAHPTLERVTECIELRDVVYRYPNSHKQLIFHQNFIFEMNKKYAIIGASGAGKSTLLNILVGNYPIVQGQVRYDNQAYTQVMDVLPYVAYVSQDTAIFEGTIEENITFNQKVDKERLEEVLKCTRLDEWAHQVAEGLDLPLDWQGKNISGGQRQRIALARALYSGKRILVLDEALSAVDEDTVQYIESQLLERSDLTLIMVTHHLLPTTQAKLDHLYTLD